MDTRERRRLRNVLAVVVCLILLLVLRLVWGSIAQHRLDRALAAAGATGDPVTPARLYPPEDYDAPDNAIPLLQSAMSAAAVADAASIWTPSQSNITYPDYPPFNPAWHQLAEAAVANSSIQSALKLARQASTRPAFRWNIKLATPLSTRLPMGSLNNCRNLANILGDLAVHANLHHDDFEALERVRDTLHLANAVNHQGMLISHLVALGIDALANRSLLQIAPGLRIGADENDPVRRDVRVLIAELTDERRATDALRQTFVSEGVYEIDSIEWQTRNAWVMRPMFELDAARLLEMNQVVLRAATQPTTRAVHDALTTLPIRQVNRFLPGAAKVVNPPRISRSFSIQAVEGAETIIDVDMRIRVEHAMAAVSLAAQLYRADHHAWPASLEVLVPAYLKAVPVDPFSAEGKPLRYMLLARALPGGLDRPIVYSVGPNGVDNTAKAVLPITPQYVQVSPMGASDDQLRDLERWVPPPTTEPAE